MLLLYLYICNCRTGSECPGTGEDKHSAVRRKSQLRLDLISAKRGKASSSDGKQSNFLQGREAWRLGRCVCWGLGFRMSLRHCQALPSLQTVTLLLFHMAINGFANDVLEDIKSD